MTATQTPRRPAIEDRALRHFVNVARYGNRPHASGGQAAAFKFAKLMLVEGVRLDDLAIEGLVQFIRGAKQAPDSARELLQPMID